MLFSRVASAISLGGACVLGMGQSPVWVLVGFSFSELALTLIHKHVWHGLLWNLHKPHHDDPGNKEWISQDSLALASGLCVGFFTQWFCCPFDVFIGTFWHYVAVLMIHDGLAHGRFGWFPTQLSTWHAQHHAKGGEDMLFSVVYAYVQHLLRSSDPTPPPNTALKVCVIGAGVGGLTTAAYLQQRGYGVTVLEKNAEIGGRCANITVGGHRFDLGASMILVKPEIDNVLAELHANVPMTRCDPPYSMRFSGDKLPFRFAKEDFERLEHGSYKKYCEFIAECSGRYHVTTSVFFKSYTWWKGLPLHQILQLLQYMTCSLLSLAKRYFVSRKLLAAVTFEMAFLGSSPSDTASSIFGVLPYTSATHGVWYPTANGMGSIPAALAKNLSDVRVSSEAKQIFPGLGVLLTDDSFVEAQVIVVNTDLHIADKLLPMDRARRNLTYAPSSVNFYWVLKPKPAYEYDDWTAHTIYMSKSFQPLFDSLPRHFDPFDPMFYVHCPSVTDQDDRVLRIVVLVPIPVGYDFAPVDMLRGAILKRMSMTTDDIIAEEVITPMQWANRLDLYRGSILGPEHSWLQMGPMRPNFRFAPGVYRVGAGTHPGTGIPCCLHSGKMVAEEIIARERSVLDNTRQSNTFAKAAWFLCADDHQKIKDLYAFFRLLDDLVDEAPGGAKGLELATKYLECVMDATDTIKDPGLARVHALGIPSSIWLEFLAGLQFDANNNNNHENKVDLDLYANQVAGTVGEAVMYALGLTEYCRAGRVLGAGLQRINICRDVQKDYCKNRYYISPCQKNHVLAQASRMIDASLSEMQTLPWRYRLAFTLAGKCYEAMGYGNSRIVAGCKAVASCIYPACYSGLQDVTRFYHTQIKKNSNKSTTL